MLTKLEFKNSNPCVIQREVPDHPTWFALYPVMEHETWKGMKGEYAVKFDTIIKAIGTIEDGIYDAGFNFEYDNEDYTDYKVLGRYNQYMGENGELKIFPDKGPIGDFFVNSKGMYGVADNL